MQSPSKLNKEEIQEALNLLQFNWKTDGIKLLIELETKNFTEAIWFINELSLAAEELNHHPDVCLKNYNHVSVSLTTHNAKGLTKKDFALAQKTDAIITRIV